MTEQEAKKWCSVLCEAEIDDVISINGTTVKVVLQNPQDIKCNQCAFYKNGGCTLQCNYVTPCSPFNNELGKPTIFKRL